MADPHSDNDARRWVRVIGIIVIIVVLLIAVMLLIGGGHGPGMHSPS